MTERRQGATAKLLNVASGVFINSTEFFPAREFADQRGGSCASPRTWGICPHKSPRGAAGSTRSGVTASGILGLRAGEQVKQNLYGKQVEKL